MAIINKIGLTKLDDGGSMLISYDRMDGEILIQLNDDYISFNVEDYEMVKNAIEQLINQ